MCRAVEIREFVIDNFLFGEDTGFENAASFREAGILDSTGILELVGFLEETYDIHVEDEDLVPENLDSIARVVQFLDRKIGGGEAGHETASGRSREPGVGDRAEDQVRAR